MLRPWQLSLSDRIDATRDTPIYMQIIEALVRDIERGRLTAGSYLPSSRELAKTLGVNRKTVVIAYEDLIAQGWLESAATRGTMVATALPDPVKRQHVDPEPTMSSIAVDYRYAAPPARPIALPGGSGLKIDEGAPDGRLFPAELLARAYRAATNRAAETNGFQYRDPRGSAALRNGIASMLRGQRGLSVTADNICITRGSQNGLFLAAQILLKPGDAVVVEALTYEPAVAAFRALGAQIVPVGLDEGGIDIDAVEHACRRNAVRAVFVTPHHQFPTTVSLRPGRRLRLIELARLFGFAIIEDDYDHEFHFQSQPLLPLASYGPGQTIYVGSMSKLLLPALRVGYVAAPPAVIDAIAHRVSLTDGMGNALTEDAAAALIETGELRRHARKAWQVYAERRRNFAAELDEALGDIADYKTPDGGLAFWLRFPGIDLDAMEARAAALGLRFASSRSFMTHDEAPRGLRIGFASLNAHEARIALAGLREAAGG